MRIQIENYFGNDILKLDFCLKDRVISDNRVELVNEIAEVCGYSVADIDTDEQGGFIRVQQANVDNSEEEERKELLELVNKLNSQFL
jgi:hypothetical protein